MCREEELGIRICNRISQSSDSKKSITSSWDGLIYKDVDAAFVACS